MRKLGKQYVQQGTNKKVKKNANELIAELSEKTKQHKKKITRQSLSKKLGISDRTLRSYKKYFASLDNPSIKLNKNDRKPPKKVLDKLSKIAGNYKIKKTRIEGNKFDKAEVETLKNVLSLKTYNRFKNEMLKPNWFGWLIRVNIAFITKQGTFDDWMTFVTSIKDRRELDQFISDQIYKKVTKKNSILGFEIIEVVINVTTTEYEANIKKSKTKKK